MDGNFGEMGLGKTQQERVSTTLIESHFLNDTILRFKPNYKDLKTPRQAPRLSPVLPEALPALRAHSERIKLHVCEGDLMAL